MMAGAALTPRVAEANPVLVVEVESGKVLFSEQANDAWYPASVTKLMTAYVALQAVHSGKIRMDSLLTVSARSASLPPSKVGLKPGNQIRLDNALKIIMVKSANDVANTIAEGISGSTEKFAAAMNSEAASLGMTSSHFVNPHGLFNEQHQSSARDMAVLGRAILLDFPEYADLFGIGAIQLGRRVMYNTNGLVGRYRGITGMKTGFICASGFNVVASAERGGKRLLLVILGAGSATERTLLASSMLDKGFSSLGLFSQTLDSLPAASASTPPNLRAQVCNKNGALSEDEDGAISASAGGNSDSGLANFFGSGALAYADSGSGKMALGPRAHAVPELVWLGAIAPASREQAAADDAPKAKPMKGKGKGKVALAVPPKTPVKPKSTVSKPATFAKPAAPPARPKTPVANGKQKPKQAAQ